MLKIVSYLPAFSAIFSIFSHFQHFQPFSAFQQFDNLFKITSYLPAFLAIFSSCLVSAVLSRLTCLKISLPIIRLVGH
jgi:hypothetical protein